MTPRAASRKIISKAKENASGLPRHGGAPAEPGAHALAERLHGTAIHLLRRLRRHDAASGLSGPRLSALSVVVFGGPMPLGDLAAAEQVRAPTMTRLVHALEQAGYVRRERAPEDRRLVRIHATARGKALLLEGRARRVSRLSEALDQLPASEKDLLVRATHVLETVVRSLA